MAIRPRVAARKSVFPGDFFGLDSVQGYLEFVNLYNESDSRIGESPKNITNHDSTYFILNQLVKEDHIVVEWEASQDESSEERLLLQQASLTSKGLSLLHELKSKSRMGAIKLRLSNLFWIVLTSAITTLIVLKIKGL